MKQTNKFVRRLEDALVENCYSFRDFFDNFYSKYSKRTYEEFINEMNFIYADADFLPEAHLLAFKDFEEWIKKKDVDRVFFYVQFIQLVAHKQYIRGIDEIQQKRSRKAVENFHPRYGEDSN
jgi:hypothetical protein